MNIQTSSNLAGTQLDFYNGVNYIGTCTTDISGNATLEPDEPVTETTACRYHCETVEGATVTAGEFALTDIASAM